MNNQIPVMRVCYDYPVTTVVIYKDCPAPQPQETKE